MCIRDRIARSRSCATNRTAISWSVLTRVATPVVQLRARFSRQKFTRASIAARIDAGAIVVIAVAIFTQFAYAVTAMKVRRWRQAGVIDGIQRTAGTVRASVVCIDRTLRENRFNAIINRTHDTFRIAARACATTAVAIVLESKAVAKLVRDKYRGVN